MALALVTKPAAIEQINGAQSDILHGRTVLDGALVQYGDAIQPGDLVAVNLDIKRATPAGALYVIEAIEGGSVAWQGCRRIMSAPAGVSIDASGRGDWHAVPSLQAHGLRIVGAVEQVMRPMH